MTKDDELLKMKTSEDGEADGGGEGHLDSKTPYIPSPKSSDMKFQRSGQRVGYSKPSPSVATSTEMERKGLSTPSQKRRLGSSVAKIGRILQ